MTSIADEIQHLVSEARRKDSEAAAGPSSAGKPLHASYRYPSLPSGPLPEAGPGSGVGVGGLGGERTLVYGPPCAACVPHV